MNRRIRDPNVRWCERRTPVYGPEPPTRLEAILTVRFGQFNGRFHLPVNNYFIFITIIVMSSRCVSPFAQDLAALAKWSTILRGFS